MQGPLLSATDSQDNTWCLVGPSGRHKHWQPAEGSAATSMSPKPADGSAAASMNPRPAEDSAAASKIPRPAEDSAAASMDPKFDFSLASLPGPAIASILHHLDIYSSHQLALTCQACAREAAHHRSHNKNDHCAKILPKVRSIAGRSYGGSPYGTSTAPGLAAQAMLCHTYTPCLNSLTSWQACGKQLGPQSHILFALTYAACGVRP